MIPEKSQNKSRKKEKRGPGLTLKGFLHFERLFRCSLHMEQVAKDRSDFLKDQLL